MKRYLSWSGGKDSSASIVLCHEKGIPLDGVVFSEVMFSHERHISGENPEHIRWVYETAIPTIEKMGYPVKVVRDKEDYLSLFHHRITKSEIPERIGKKTGWFIGGMCLANDRLKMRPLREFFKSVGECEQVLGIARNEPERLLRLKKNCWSILDKEGICEADTYDICTPYNLLSATEGKTPRIKKLYPTALGSPYDKPVTLNECLKIIEFDGEGVVTVIFEEALRGEIYEYGNYSSNCWVRHGTTVGYA